MNWLIIRTEQGKEEFVEQQLLLKEIDAWWPYELQLHRIHSKSKKLDTKKRSVMPKRLFAAVPRHMEAEVCAIRHVDTIIRDAASVALSVPYAQLKRFMDRIRELNDATEALRRIPTRKQKAEWVNLEDGLKRLYKQDKADMGIAA